MLIRSAAHQHLSTTSTLVPILDISGKAVASHMTKVKGAICVRPGHENSDVLHVLAQRSVKLDIYVMFARSRLERNAVENQNTHFSTFEKTPRGIRIG